MIVSTWRTALRTLARSPGFAIGAILTLALGIGLSTAVFTVADTLLLRPLPVRDQDRVVLLWGDKRDGSVTNYPLSVDDSRAFARRTRALERVAFAMYQGALPVPVRDGDQVSRLRLAYVTGEFFDVLGVRPVLGRTLRASDDVAGAARVVVVSHGLWQRRFGGAADVIGRRFVTLDGDAAWTIVGVMPQGLDYPKGTEVWTPFFAFVPAKTVPLMAMTPVGRLASNATIANAGEEMTGFFSRPEASQAQRTFVGNARSLPRQVLGETRMALFAFAAAAALLLLITCINVANLLLVRGLARVREIAVRSALGASRAALVAQLVIENTLLAFGGGVLGVAIAAVAIRVFVAVAPGGTPRVDEIRIDATVLGGAFGIAALAMLLFALAPAVLASRVAASEALRAGAKGSASRRSRVTSEVLVAGQVAIAMLVLSAAGLITRSLVKLERADLSFDPRSLLIAELSIRADRYSDAAQQRALLERLMTRVQSLPGVRAATPMVAAPFSGASGWDGRLASEEQSAAQAANNPMLDLNVVTPEFFDTFELRMVRGRALTADDREGAATAVVISESAARYFWPGGDPIGRRLRMGNASPSRFTVVGVVPDLRYRDLREARASIYFPLRQSFFPFAPLVIAIRTTSDPATLIPALRETITTVDPALALASAAPLESFLNGPLGQARLNALLLDVFAGSALVLCAVGLLGVMLTMVRQRTRELGVRIALGATTGELRVMVLRRGLTIALAGLAVGAAGALAANRALSAMLYAVSPWDALTFAVVALLLIVVAAVASSIPARAAARVDPVAALRADA